MAFAILMTASKTYNNADEQIYDRCYRLRYNKGQVRTDKFTYGGLVLGGLGGAYAGLSTVGPFVSGLQGASMGVGLAVLAHVLTKRSSAEKSKEDTKKVNKEDEKVKDTPSKKK